MYSQSVGQDFDPWTRESFCENICQHLLGWQVLHGDVSVVNCISDKIQPNVEVLRPGMLLIAMSDGNTVAD